MSYWFSFALPWLVVLWFLQLAVSRLRARHRWTLPGLGLVSMAIVFLPAGGIPLGRWMAGLNLLPSVPLLGLLAGLVWKNSGRTELLSSKDRRAAWIFGSLAGAVLYPLSLGLGRFDPYAWGWSLSPLFPITALATMLLIWKQNRFGLLLLLAILAYDARCLESNNFWDFLVDPVYWLLSLASLARAALSGTWHRQRLSPTEEACPSANSR